VQNPNGAGARPGSNIKPSMWSTVGRKAGKAADASIETKFNAQEDVKRELIKKHQRCG